MRVQEYNRKVKELKEVIRFLTNATHFDLNENLKKERLTLIEAKKEKLRVLQEVRVHEI